MRNGKYNYCNDSAATSKVGVTVQIAHDLFEFKEKMRSVLLAHEHF